MKLVKSPWECGIINRAVDAQREAQRDIGAHE